MNRKMQWLLGSALIIAALVAVSELLSDNEDVLQLAPDIGDLSSQVE